ncbi:MAG: efflux RND transporter periplasmic adaptor subunit [Kiritimatiellae bacterium]|nr:efflux RND transporter periplasmic adaptor subunit [Kiritimatiellia bacterium]
MKKTFLVAGAVLLAAIVLFVSCPRRRATPPDSSILVAAVQEGPLTITVRGSGEIQAIKPNKIKPQIRRSVEITFLAPEGSRVTNGQAIARFNTDEIEQRIMDLEHRLTDHQTQLDSNRTDLEIQQLDNATNLKQAEQAVESARMQQEKFLEGDDPMERRQAELRVKTAASELARRKRRYAEMPDLLKEGFITEDQVEEERMAVEACQVALETAEIEIRLLQDYTLPLKKAQVENALAKAETELEKTRKRSETLLKNKTQALEAAKRRVERTQFELDRERELLNAYEVQAPTDGVVTYGDPDNPWRRGEIVVGGRVYRGQVLMTIPDRSAMQAVVNVPEAQIQYVREGQQAAVSVEAVPEKYFPGTVSQVAEVANEQSRWGGVDVKEFRVAIELHDGADLRPGFSCDAEITTETIERTRYLPVQAVFREEDRFFVYPVGPTGEKAEVTIGKASMTHVEILEGVAADTQVHLAKPAEKEEGREED